MKGWMVVQNNTRFERGGGSFCVARVNRACMMKPERFIYEYNGVHLGF